MIESDGFALVDCSSFGKIAEGSFVLCVSSVEPIRFRFKLLRVRCDIEGDSFSLWLFNRLLILQVSIALA